MANRAAGPLFVHKRSVCLTIIRSLSCLPLKKRKKISKETTALLSDNTTMASEKDTIGGVLTFPQLNMGYGLITGVIGAASLINPSLCYDLVGQPSRWVPVLESSAGLYTLRLLGLQTLAMSALSIHASLHIREPVKRQQMGHILAALNIGNGIIAACMYREGLLNGMGLAVHSGLSVVLGVGYLFFSCKCAPAQQVQ